jgi:hypothetical protein
VPAADGGPSTIFFDNEGAENGITVQGTTDFSIFGANWTDGLVISVGMPNLYGSVPAAYRVPAGNTVTVSFDEPINAATFFYVTESLTPSTATAFARSEAVGAGGEVGLRAVKPAADTSPWVA